MYIAILDLSSLDVVPKFSICVIIIYRSLGALDVAVAFVPLYDHTGTTQLTCHGEEWKDLLSSLRTETVVKATGVVQARPDEDQNKV